MYPIQCSGGFFIGLKAGKFEVVAVSATVDDATANSRIGLIDDRNLPTNAITGMIRGSDYDVQDCIIDVRGVANADGVLEFMPPEAIKIRHGLSVVHADNIEAGTLKVYVR